MRIASVDDVLLLLLMLHSF